MRVFTRMGLAGPIAAALLLLCAGSAYCQLWGNTYQFYPARGYYNGGVVFYLPTDASNQSVAQGLKVKTGFNINYTPLLSNALAPALRVFNDIPSQPNRIMEFMPSLYLVTNAPPSIDQAQFLVFSAQWPVPSQVAGYISALNSVNGTITLNGPGCGLPGFKLITFTFDPNTLFIKNGVVVGPGALCECDQVVALIARNAQGIPVAIRIEATTPTTSPPLINIPVEATPPGTYMPLWRLKLVTWNNPANAVVLKSEAAILNSIGAGVNQLQVVDAATVVGASIVINSFGQRIPQAFVGSYAGGVLVRLPVKAVYANNAVWKIVQLDFSDIGRATTTRGNYAPWLKRLNEARFATPVIPPAFQPIYTFWPAPVLSQLWVVSQVPSPFGPGNTNGLYSPVMNDWIVRTSGPTIYKSAAQILAAMGLIKNPTNYLAFEPVVGQ